MEKREKIYATLIESIKKAMSDAARDMNTLRGEPTFIETDENTYFAKLFCTLVENFSSRFTPNHPSMKSFNFTSDPLSCDRLFPKDSTWQSELMDTLNLTFRGIKEDE
jgi:hypothetical protein